MLWRDLAGRLRGLAVWIDRYRESDHWVARDAVLRELYRLYLEASGETSDHRPLQGPGGISREEAATVRPNPKLTGREAGEVRMGAALQGTVDRIDRAGGHPPAGAKAEGKESL